MKMYFVTESFLEEYYKELFFEKIQELKKCIEFYAGKFFTGEEEKNYSMNY